MNSLPFSYRLLTLVFLFAFALYDHRHHKVRNSALLAFLPWCLLSIPLQTFTDTDFIWLSVIYALLGGINGGFLLLTASLLTNGGIGGGDIKLTALLGFITGATGILITVTLASLAALPYAIYYKKRNCKPARIAFVPFLFLGMLAVLLL